MHTETAKYCHFCGGSELSSPGPWIRAEFLDFTTHDGEHREAWVCSRGRDAYMPGEPDDLTSDEETCRGLLLDEFLCREHGLGRWSHEPPFGGPRSAFSEFVHGLAQDEQDDEPSSGEPWSMFPEVMRYRPPWRRRR
jgi:hypothetical protein